MQLAQHSAHYRLLYVQPDPERGERVCTAVLLRAGRSYDLLYDSNLSKLRCLAPETNAHLVRFYLDDLRQRLAVDADVESALSGYSPHFSSSSERRVNAPPTAGLGQWLLERYVMPRSDAQLDRPDADSLRTTAKGNAQVADFARRLAARHSLAVIEKAKPIDVIGRSSALISPVAAAIRTKDAVVIIDGVDIGASPKRGISRANHVVHTFWQYSREGQSTLQSEIKSVGMIFGSAPRYRTRRSMDEWVDAHDYIKTQFNEQADLTVEESSQSDLASFEELIAG